MRLYIRTQEPGERREHIQYDVCVEVTSQREWKAQINALGKQILTSVLLPEPPFFRLDGPHLYTRKHKHEVHYVYDPEINESYRQAAERLALRLSATLEGSQRCLVYLPLRGALPIWRTIRAHFPSSFSLDRLEEYQAVTSSFVMYPKHLKFVGKHGGLASGRFANILELTRIRDWCLEPMGFDHLLYVDEIISGGMMRGHVNEMLQLGIPNRIPVTVAALADSFGNRSKANGYLGKLVEQGKLNEFLWEGCDTLISEDQKFLLGMHYVDHAFGPHVVPVMTNKFEWFEEKLQFERDVMTRKTSDAF